MYCEYWISLLDIDIEKGWIILEHSMFGKNARFKKNISPTPLTRNGSLLDAQKRPYISNIYSNDEK